MIIVLSTGESLKTGGDFGIGGWTPVPALVTVAGRVVQQVVDWTGGSGNKPEVGLYVGPDGLVEDPADATNVKGDPGAGLPGADAWTAIEAIVEDGERRVKQVVDWVGGTGEKPATGMYVGPEGYVALASQATDVRGPAGDETPESLRDKLADLPDEERLPVEAVKGAAQVVINTTTGNTELLGPDGMIIAPNIVNFKTTNTSRLRASISDAAGGLVGSRWGVIGGSAVRGEGATGQGRAGNAAASAWFSRLSSILDANGVPSNWGSLTPSGGWRDASGGYPSGKAFVDYPEHDSRVAFSGTITGGPQNTLGGRPWRFNAAAGSLIFQPAKSYDRVTVIHHNNAFASNANVSAGSGSATINNGGNASVISSPSFTLGAPITTPVTVSWVSGDAMFMSIITENTQVPAINLMNLGVCGAATANFLETGAALSPFSTALRDAYDLDVVFICFTGNDISQGVSLATYRSNLEALVHHWGRGGLTDVVMVSGPPYDASIVSTAVQDSYIAVFRDVAQGLNLPLIDFWQHTVSRAFRALDTGYYADNIHAGPIGQIRWAEMFAPVLV
ncbi:SGNH/GDSL hydrolase family protein [Methylobacillus pratensis]